MAFSTFPAQERYSKNKGEGAESRKKLKKVRSVKVANLDKLWLSMRRQKSRHNRGRNAPSDDRTDPSESSYTPMSGSSSPNYMKATTSSSARKGSLQTGDGSGSGSGSVQSNSASSSGIWTLGRKKKPASAEKPNSKFNRVPVEECSNPAGVNIPVEIKSGKSLNRVSSVKRSRSRWFSGLRSSMRLGPKKLQSPDVVSDEPESSGLDIPEFDDSDVIVGGGMEQEEKTEDLNVNENASHDQLSMVKVGGKQQLQRSRSFKLTRLRSVRSSRRRAQSRLGGGATTQMSHEADNINNAKPHYMKVTTSQETRKNSATGLTRTSSLRRVRILAKIPSLRSKRSKVKKPPEATSMSGVSVDRATCSSTLKSSKVPDQVELPSGVRDVCPYSYCSLHGHHHRAPPPPLKEVISAKRKMLNNQKGKKLEHQFREEVEPFASVREANDSTHVVMAEIPASKEVTDAWTINALEDEDTDVDFLVKIYAKPRRKWAIEGHRSGDAEALRGSISNRTNDQDSDWKLVETLTGTSKARPEAFNDTHPESYQIFNLSNIQPGDRTQQHKTKISVSNSTLELPVIVPKSALAAKALQSIGGEVIQSSVKESLHVPTKDPEVGPRGDVISILSDKQKYTSIWNLIYQQFVSSGDSMAGNEGANVDERVQGGDANNDQMNLDLEQSKENKNLNEGEDQQTVATEKVEYDQNAAIQLVEEALNAILQREEKSSPIRDEEMPHVHSLAHILTPKASSEENFEDGGNIVKEDPSYKSEEKLDNLEQTKASLQQKAASNEGKTHENKMSKSSSKLRKLFVTAKFIKAMERLRRITPRKPQYLSPEPTSEEERVYLRHLSMKGRKDDEEWMLDHALRQVISRLAPDQQRRVALLVEAFETFTPEQKQKGIRCYPSKGEPALGTDLPTTTNEEPKLIVEPDEDITISYEQVSQKQDNGIPPSCEGAPEEEISKEDHICEAAAAGNDTSDGKNLPESDETDISHSTTQSSSNNSRSTSLVTAYEEPNQAPVEIPSQVSMRDGVSVAGDMNSILFDKQKYTGMWNLIYQHVTSNEVLVDADNGDNGSDEKGQGFLEMKDLVPTPSSYNKMHKEEDNQNAASENNEFNQSAAVKLIKEAVIAILQRHEQSSNQHSIGDHDKATNDAAERCTSSATYSSGEDAKGDERQDMHTLSESMAKLHQVEKSSDEFQQQVEPNESKMPQKKMSKSYSKLKKAIVTAKFIKAMERLRKINLQKPQNLHPEAASEEERVYLRHLSMDRRKNFEEWMLDYALRQVISKLDPDQQRRVASLVEAFETVTPEQQQNSIRCYPWTSEYVPDVRLSKLTSKAPKKSVKSEQERSISDEQVPQKPDTGFLLSSIGTREQRTLHEAHDHQERASDEETQQDAENTGVPDSNLKLSEDSSKSASVDVVLKDPTTEDGETTTVVKVPSKMPIEDYEISLAGEMTTILSDKQKYTSMWHLIYQHAVSSEAPIAGKQGGNEVDEDEYGEDASNTQENNEFNSTQSNHITNQKENEDSQNAACERSNIDQSAAIKLVKDAISKILQCHEQISDEQSFQDPHISSDIGGELGNRGAPVSTEVNSRGKRGENHRSLDTDEKLHLVENTNAPLGKQANPDEVQISQGKTSKSYSKLKKFVAAANFIKAMERLKRRSPRKPRFLSPEEVSEEERVHLRHQDINERRNDEEWMLDYALRKVISNLHPDQQRKVAKLVEAFEAVTPERNDNCTRSQSRAELPPDVVESKHHKSTSYEDNVQTCHDDIISSRSQQDNYPIDISKCRTEQHDEDLDSDGNNLHAYNLLRPKVTKEETDSNPMCESLQQACLYKETKQESEAKTKKSMFSDSQKHTTMWHLIYQHVKSVTVAETGSNLGERVANEDLMTSGNALSETNSDVDDNDTSSVASELTENDAIKLVKEAIDGILDVPLEQDNDLLSGNITVVPEDQRATVGEKPERSLSRGYSKLRKLIICNKFIRTMEKIRKSYPQKHQNLMMNPDQESEKAHLKPCVAGEKNTDNWMLDYALQKVIAGLAPVQQRRVAMLVEAFEKVNPEVQETGQAFGGIKNESTDGGSTDNSKEKDLFFNSSENSSELPGRSMKLGDSLVTSSRETSTGRAPQEIKEGTTSTKECELKGQDSRSDEPSSTTVATSATIGTIPDLHKDTKEVNSAEVPHSNVPLKENSSTGEKLDKYNDQETESTAEPSQHEDLEDDCNSNTENSKSINRKSYTNLWCLLAQHLKSDVPEEKETQIPCEIDAVAEDAKVSHDEDVDVKTPKSAGFEFQQKEAIKLVQEALDEILCLPDQTFDDQTMHTSETNPEVCNGKHGDGREPSPSTEELAGVGTLQDTGAIPQEENTSPKAKAPSSYSMLSKVILCKRFIKAMDQMRKLKPQSPSYQSPQLQSEAESFQSLRPSAAKGKKSWEEWMLDHAMQQVVGKLAPAQKKKVSLLVQAFETVGSEPEPRPSWKVKAAAL